MLLVTHSTSSLTDNNLILHSLGVHNYTLYFYSWTSIGTKECWFAWCDLSLQGSNIKIIPIFFETLSKNGGVLFCRNGISAREELDIPEGWCDDYKCGLSGTGQSRNQNSTQNPTTS